MDDKAMFASYARRRAQMGMPLILEKEWTQEMKDLVVSINEEVAGAKQSAEIQQILADETRAPWRNPIDKADYEQALDAGKLYAKATAGAWWLARRNGRTKLWKRTPDKYRIPIKTGLRQHQEITHLSNVENFRIADSRVAAEDAKYKAASHSHVHHRY